MCDLRTQWMVGPTPGVYEIFIHPKQLVVRDANGLMHWTPVRPPHLQSEKGLVALFSIAWRPIPVPEPWREGLPSEPCVCDVVHVATGQVHLFVRVEWLQTKDGKVLAARLARGVHLYGDGHVWWRPIAVPELSPP